MFKQTINGYRIPEAGTVERLEARPASRGGGWILEMTVNGNVDTMVFGSQVALTQTLMAMLNGAALAQMAAAAQGGNPPPPDVSRMMKTEQLNRPVHVGDGAVKAAETVEIPAPKKKGGRPKGAKLTDEQKAAMKAARAAKKANSANIPAEEKQAA